MDVSMGSRIRIIIRYSSVLDGIYPIYLYYTVISKKGIVKGYTPDSASLSVVLWFGPCVFVRVVGVNTTGAGFLFACFC